MLQEKRIKLDDIVRHPWVGLGAQDGEDAAADADMADGDSTPSAAFSNNQSLVLDLPALGASEPSSATASARPSAAPGALANGGAAAHSSLALELDFGMLNHKESFRDRRGSALHALEAEVERRPSVQPSAASAPGPKPFVRMADVDNSSPSPVSARSGPVTVPVAAPSAARPKTNGLSKTGPLPAVSIPNGSRGTGSPAAAMTPPGTRSGAKAPVLGGLSRQLGGQVPSGEGPQLYGGGHGPNAPAAAGPVRSAVGKAGAAGRAAANGRQTSPAPSIPEPSGGSVVQLPPLTKLGSSYQGEEPPARCDRRCLASDLSRLPAACQVTNWARRWRARRAGPPRRLERCRSPRQSLPRSRHLRQQQDPTAMGTDCHRSGAARVDLLHPLCLVMSTPAPAPVQTLLTPGARFGSQRSP